MRYIFFKVCCGRILPLLLVGLTAVSFYVLAGKAGAATIGYCNSAQYCVDDQMYENSQDINRGIQVGCYNMDPFKCDCGEQEFLGCQVMPSTFCVHVPDDPNCLESATGFGPPPPPGSYYCPGEDVYCSAKEFCRCGGSASGNQCGNGILDPGEACDEGSNNGYCGSQTSGGKCDPSCAFYHSCTGGGGVCGDGNVNTPDGEQCDEGDNNGSCPAACSSTCTVNNNCVARVAIITGPDGIAAVTRPIVPNRGR